MLAHPDWGADGGGSKAPVPWVLWMHGRTVSKEIDNGRFLRLIRAGIACCAVDLPGHGERFEEGGHDPSRTPLTIAQMVREIDSIVEAVTGPAFGGGGGFNPNRIAIGGMSAGGMVTLRRLCDPHRFTCAVVEGTAGNLGMLYSPGLGRANAVQHAPGVIEPIDPMRHAAGWRPIPLLALHSEADSIVPLRCLTSFTDVLRERYVQAGVEPSMVEVRTWPQTGAPQEHNGFGLVANEAKTTVVDFLVKHLLNR